jgi:hypothetical protein
VGLQQMAGAGDGVLSAEVGEVHILKPGLKQFNTARS